MRDVGRPVACSSSTPLKLAYADPPYPGKAAYYRGHPDYAGEVDHRELIRRLGAYDGWALSTSARALPAVLELCPRGVRVAAWVRGSRANSAAHGPLNAWEPVLYFGGRAEPSRVDAQRLERRREDVLIHGVTPRTTDPRRVIGAKPAAFARWLFVELLGAQAHDELEDLYPGSGGIGRAWELFAGRGRAAG